MSKEVILVGGGHSHVQVLESLATKPLEAARVTVLVDRPLAVYSGMVPGFVAGQYRGDELEIDVPALARRAGVECRVAAVVHIDPTMQRLQLADGSSVSYDIASFNIGSTVAGLDLPGIREFALPTRPISELVERAEAIVAAAGRRSDSPFRIVAVGGGVGGIELAFTFCERVRRTGRSRVATRLVHRGGRILDGYPARLVEMTHRAAADRGIEIHCNRTVIAAEADRVRLDGGEAWPYDVLLWVTGAVGHDLFRGSRLPVDQRGFVQTRATLQMLEHDRLFAVGDCATMLDYPRLPKAGVYAVRQGPYLTRNLRRLLAGRALATYRPQSEFLTLLNLGDGTALGAKGGFCFEGRWVMWLKDRIDRRFMRRFQSAG